MTTQIQPTSGRRRRLEVVVQPSFLYDVLAAVWTALGGNDKAGTHELSKRWFTDLRHRIPADVVETISAFGGDSGKLWLGFVDLIGSAPDPADVTGTIEWLRGLDWDPTRRQLFTEMCWQADPLDVDNAIEGDGASLDRCLANYDQAERDSLELLLTFPGDRFPETLASVLSTLVGEVMPDDTADWMEAYQCSRQAVEPLVEMMEPGDLIERVTNGMDYDIPLGVRRIVLVPSVVIRPWTIAHELGDRVYVLYPIADEHLSADPDAPPQWLVHFHKALGDERRLRMLRRLAERPASLTELTSEVDLAKSTVFHHIGVLRAAGLIRVHVGSRPDKNPVYSLRLHALETAYEHTSRYLEGPERTEEP